MKPGDMLTIRRKFARPKILGLLLEEPQFPTYGNFPKKYRVLTPDGRDTIVLDMPGYTVGVLQ